MSEKPYLKYTVYEVSIGRINFSYIFPSTLRTREVYRLTKEEKKCLGRISGVFLSSFTLDIPAKKKKQ